VESPETCGCIRGRAGWAAGEPGWVVAQSSVGDVRVVIDEKSVGDLAPVGQGEVEKVSEGLGISFSPEGAALGEEGLEGQAEVRYKDQEIHGEVASRGERRPVEERRGGVSEEDTGSEVDNLVEGRECEQRERMCFDDIAMVASVQNASERSVPHRIDECEVPPVSRRTTESGDAGGPDVARPFDDGHVGLEGDVFTPVTRPQVLQRPVCRQLQFSPVPRNQSLRLEHAQPPSHRKQK